MTKLKRAYGTHRYVCYRHRSKIGGSVMSFGECENCQSRVSSNVGSCPKLCDKCSLALAECAECRERLAVVRELIDDEWDRMECPVPCERCRRPVELHAVHWQRNSCTERDEGLCDDCYEENTEQ